MDYFKENWKLTKELFTRKFIEEFKQEPSEGLGAIFLMLLMWTPLWLLLFFIYSYVSIEVL